MKTDAKQTVYLQATELTVVDYNPRNWSSKRLRQLAGSIKRDKQFFESRPCLVNLREDGSLVVYAGCLRYCAAVDVLKWKKVPCVVESISIDLERQRNLLDNSHAGNFDELMLRDFNLTNDQLRDIFLDEFVFDAGHDGDGDSGQAGRTQDVVFKVVVTCQDEIQQAQLIQELEDRGFQCTVFAT